MPEIYKIQTSANGTFLPSQDRVQLQNDAGQYLQQAARNLQEIGTLIDDRSNREAVGKMAAAKEQVDAYIKDFSSFESPDYHEQMVAGAMKIWDDAFAGMTRNERAMFNRNNPSAREIMGVGIVKAASEKALNHEVEASKIFNDQKSITVAIDDNGRVRTAQQAVDILNDEINRILENPVYQKHPDAARKVIMDLGNKSSRSYLDMAIASGKYSEAEKALGSDTVKSFINGQEYAQYYSAIQREKERVAKDAAQGGGSEGKVVKAENLFTEMYDAGVRGAEAIGDDPQKFVDSYYRVLSAIQQGTPLKELTKVAMGDIEVVEKAVTSDPNIAAAVNAGVLGIDQNNGIITWEQVFGDINKYNLQTAANNAGSKIAKARDSYFEGSVGRTHAYATKLEQSIIKRQNDYDKFSDIEKDDRIIGSQMNLSEYNTVKDVYKAYRENSVALNDVQKKKMNEFGEYLREYEGKAGEGFGMAVGHITDLNAEYKSDKTIVTGAKNVFFGNRSPAQAMPIKNKGIEGNTLGEDYLPEYLKHAKSDISLIAGQNPFASNEPRKPGEYEGEVREVWDSMVNPVQIYLEKSKTMPERGSIDYIIKAAAMSLFVDANYIDEKTGDISEFAKTAGVVPGSIHAGEVIDTISYLRSKFAADPRAASTRVDTDRSLAAKDTQTYQILKEAYQHRGLHPTESQLESLTNSLRSSFGGFMKREVWTMSEEQEELMGNRRLKKEDLE